MFRIANNLCEISKNGSDKSEKIRRQNSKKSPCLGGSGGGSPPEGAGHLPLNLIVASENEIRPNNN